MLVLADMCDTFNYADDNTACCYDTSIQGVLKKLNKVVYKMLIWFSMFEMKVNNDKFQLIDTPGTERSLSVNVDEIIIQNQPVVKLLGLHVDSYLVLTLTWMKYAVRQEGN